MSFALIDADGWWLIEISWNDSEVQTSKPSASVDHQIQAQTSLPAWPPHISAKRAPSELDRHFSAMVQQRNKEIETGTGLALFREVKSYEQRAPYPTPDLSTSPSSVKGKQLDTREESSLRQLYGGWKGFWDLSNPCVQASFATVIPGRDLRLTYIDIT